MDKAVEYIQKLEGFVNTLNTENQRVAGDTWQVETGRKFDKVFVQGKIQKHGRYMVDRNSWTIYGIKSWAQINPRRTFGTIDTVAQFDWSGYTGNPKSGTAAEKEHTAREAEIAKTYKKRGRPRKNP
jgi:hypothetical protein